MRWIDKGCIEKAITADWREKIKAVVEALRQATTPEDRKKIIGENSLLWGKEGYRRFVPKNLLEKCWYCEIKIERADVHTDHFRPKNAVIECPDHEGYWWLAFNWENYRCICGFCNTRRILLESEGGKGCHFPLINEEKRVRNELGNIDDEEPILLDPFHSSDWKLLWFDQDGQPIAKPDIEEASVNRVNNTIDIYHLHDRTLNRKRNDIRLKVEENIRKLKSGTDVEEVKQNLMRMVSDQAELSKAAIVYLRNHRSLEAVKDIINLD